jgi:hypothetical protein
MPAHYTLPSFLRQLSRDLLTELFLHHRIDLGLDLKVPKKRGIEPIVSAVNRLPDEQRQILDPAFRNIQALANRTSTWPDCRARNRSLGDRGTKLTLLASLKIAAAIARQ